MPALVVHATAAVFHELGTIARMAGAAIATFDLLDPYYFALVNASQGPRRETYERHMREIQRLLRKEAVSSWGSDFSEAIAKVRQAGLNSNSTRLIEIADAARELDALCVVALDIERYSHPSTRTEALLRAIWAGEQCARHLSSLVESVARDASAAMGQIEVYRPQPVRSLAAQSTSSRIPTTTWRKVADTPRLTWPRIPRVGADPSEELTPREIMEHRAAASSKPVAVLDTPSGRCELTTLQARILDALRTGRIHVLPWSEQEYVEPRHVEEALGSLFQFGLIEPLAGGQGSVTSGSARPSRLGRSALGVAARAMRAGGAPARARIGPRREADAHQAELTDRSEHDDESVITTRKYGELRLSSTHMILLQHLRRCEARQRYQASAVRLDVDAVSATPGLDRYRVEASLLELAEMGLVEAHLAGYLKLENGACRLTTMGRSVLATWDASRRGATRMGRLSTTGL